MKKHALWGAVVALVATPAFSASVLPIAYSMQNGMTGSYSYWDESYDGIGDVHADAAALSGGTGDLTDGIIATDNWYVVEAPAGNGPYVGWETLSPTITFSFDTGYDFTSVTFHFDDADGAGGVYAPGGVRVNGIMAAITDPTGPSPLAYTLDLSGLAETDTLAATILPGGPWTFLSEVTFDADVAPVPLPAGLPLLTGALLGLGLMRRKRV